MGKTKHTEQVKMKVLDLADKGVSDVVISNQMNVAYGWVNPITTRYWEDKMKIKQVDDYLKKNWPGGNTKEASIVLGCTELFVKRRVMALKLDPNMIFETVSYFKDENQKCN
jgi:hypothetical protein